MGFCHRVMGCREGTGPFSPQTQSRKALTPRIVWEKPGEYHSPSKFLYFYFWPQDLTACGIFPNQDRTCGPCIGGMESHHRTAREVPRFLFTPSLLPVICLWSDASLWFHPFTANPVTEIFGPNTRSSRAQGRSQGDSSSSVLPGPPPHPAHPSRWGVAAWLMARLV